MRLTSTLVGSAVLLLVVGVRAQAPAPAKGAADQMKLTATLDCPKTDPTAQAEVGDAPGHALMLFKVKCTYSSGDLAGVKIQTEEDTITTDLNGNTGRDSGYGVVTTANNDKVFLRFQGTTTFKNNAPVNGQGTWSFTTGTGKMKGLKGKGTYKGTFKPDGSVSWQVEGDYQVAAPAAKK